MAEENKKATEEVKEEKAKVEAEEAKASLQWKLSRSCMATV